MRKRFCRSTESSSARDDLASYRARWHESTLVGYAGRRVATRGGLSGVPELLPRLPQLTGLTQTERVLALLEAFEPQPEGGEHTTNMVAVDGHGRACVLTHSLGVGAGVWLPGFDVQLNNLLGESDIVSGDPQRGDHLESRMAPSLVFDADGLELAIGSAGATRLRTALATVLAAILDEGLDAETAVALPRVHPTARSRRCRARRRRVRARDARGERPHRAALGSAPPLLRRRELRRPGGRCGRPAPQWIGDLAVAAS